MYSILVLLASIAAVFLIVVVLMQSSKGGGLAGTFGGAGIWVLCLEQEELLIF